MARRDKVPTQPTVFLSHGTADRPWASKLELELKHQGYDVFFAERDLRAGEVWPIKLAREILSRDVFVIVLTPESWASKWVKSEYSLAELHNKRIISVLLKPTTTIGFLEIYQSINGIGQEPRSVAKELIQELLRIGVEAGADRATGDEVRTLVQAEASGILPDSLQEKEYQAWIIGGLEVVIPPTQFVLGGTFRMGSDPQVDKDAEEDELPQHEVSVPSFYIGVYPVTVCEYRCAVKARIVHAPPYSRISWEQQLQHPDHPVVNVSWHDAVQYGRWLSGITEQSWRLLTEAEWEKGAKGGRDVIFPWGHRWSIACANAQESQFGATTPVGMFGAGVNGYRLYDVGGNTWEWCASPFKDYPYTDEQLPLDDERRVVRGGSWNSSARDVRAAKRRAHFPGAITPTVGFRLAKEKM